MRGGRRVGAVGERTFRQQKNRQRARARRRRTQSAIRQARAQKRGSAPPPPPALSAQERAVARERHEALADVDAARQRHGARRRLLGPGVVERAAVGTGSGARVLPSCLTGCPCLMCGRRRAACGVRRAAFCALLGRAPLLPSKTPPPQNDHAHPPPYPNLSTCSGRARRARRSSPRGATRPSSAGRWTRAPGAGGARAGSARTFCLCDCV